jgi:4'-phosphopantetheinyl transferase
MNEIIAPEVIFCDQHWQPILQAHPGHSWPKLDNDSVHIWLMSVKTPLLAALEAMLSDDELQRANRYTSTENRSRYIVARANLRSILGRYLQQSPVALQFTYNECGKPRLAGDGVTGIFFNLTHCDDLVLLAVARHPLGVDLENMRPIPEIATLAQRFIEPVMAEEVCRLDGEAQLSAFYRSWTQQEAWIKANGEGLGITDCKSAANQFDHSTIANHTLHENFWNGYQFSPAPQFIAALVTAGGPKRLLGGYYQA